MARADVEGFDFERRTSRFDRKREMNRRWKGKGKERERDARTPRGVVELPPPLLGRRDQGSGGSDGIVVNMSLVGDGTWEA